MSSNYWAKIWIEMLDDRKVMTLPESLRWRFIECILMAKEYNRDGVLPPVEEMTFRVRLNDTSAFNADMSRLAQAGLVELVQTTDGERWFLPAFEERQSKAISVNDRVRRHRERKEAESNAIVTPVKRHVTKRYPETETETETETDAEAAPDWDTFLEKNGIEEPANAEERELLKHPAAKVWLKTTGRWPTWAGLRAITSRLGPEPDAALLREEYDLWTAAGYNPGNIAGILDRYERRTGSAGKPKRTQPQPATTGHVGGY